jgi:hypothetical protein
VDLHTLTLQNKEKQIEKNMRKKTRLGYKVNTIHTNIFNITLKLKLIVSIILR